LIELVFIKDVASELKMDSNLIPLFTDSTNSISFIRKNSVSSIGVCHLDVKLSQLYQEFCKNTFYPVKIHTGRNPADLLTKPFMKNYQVMKEHINRISGVNKDFQPSRVPTQATHRRVSRQRARFQDALERRDRRHATF